MDFFETIRSRYSLRRFSSQPVSQEDILTIIEAATLAPSATNEQPWRFIVVRDNQLKKDLRDVVKAVLGDSITDEDNEARRKRLARMRFYGTHFGAAPVAIAVLAHPWKGGGYSSHPDSTSHDLAIQSVAMAVDHLMLAATALGYGSCYASAPAEFARMELEAILNIESPWFLLGIISLGVATGPPKDKAPRKHLDEVCTFIDEK